MGRTPTTRKTTTSSSTRKSTTHPSLADNLKAAGKGILDAVTGNHDEPPSSPPKKVIKTMQTARAPAKKTKAKPAEAEVVVHDNVSLRPIMLVSYQPDSLCM